MTRADLERTVRRGHDKLLEGHPLYEAFKDTATTFLRCRLELLEQELESQLEANDYLTRALMAAEDRIEALERKEKS